MIAGAKWDEARCGRDTITLTHTHTHTHTLSLSLSHTHILSLSVSLSLCLSRHTLSLDWGFRVSAEAKWDEARCSRDMEPASYQKRTAFVIRGGYD